MAAAEPSASSPPAAAAVSVLDRAVWEKNLAVGDSLDTHVSAAAGLTRGWFVCRVIATTSTHVQLAMLFWNAVSANWVTRTSSCLQPLGSKTKGQYTGPPHRLTAFLQSLTLPSLAAVPLHPNHQLQQFSFDFDWACSKCEKKKSAGQSQAYSCLPCKYDLCVDCFIADGGIDTPSASCIEPSTKRSSKEMASYVNVDFMVASKEHECQHCKVTAMQPANLLCGQYEQRRQRVLTRMLLRAGSQLILRLRASSPGHLCCMSCLSSQRCSSCPLCSVPFNPSTLQANHFVQHVVERRIVYCPSRSHGCGWVDKLGPGGQTLMEHVSECHHRFASLSKL
jgi:hypothetical protein